MADDDSEDEEPAVVLGDSAQVEGAPLARVAARLMWGIEKSEIERREGDTTIRTPDGPRELNEVLADVDQTYFGTRQEFVEAVRAVIGSGPVPAPAAAENPAEEDAPEEADASEPEAGEGAEGDADDDPAEDEAEDNADEGSETDEAEDNADEESETDEAEDNADEEGEESEKDDET
jgi:hypothetical protein